MHHIVPSDACDALYRVPDGGQRDKRPTVLYEGKAGPLQHTFGGGGVLHAREASDFDGDDQRCKRTTLTIARLQQCAAHRQEMRRKSSLHPAGSLNIRRTTRCAGAASCGRLKQQSLCKRKGKNTTRTSEQSTSRRRP